MAIQVSALPLLCIFASHLKLPRSQRRFLPAAFQLAASQAIEEVALHRNFPNTRLHGRRYVIS